MFDVEPEKNQICFTDRRGRQYSSRGVRRCSGREFDDYSATTVPLDLPAVIPVNRDDSAQRLTNSAEPQLVPSNQLREVQKMASRVLVACGHRVQDRSCEAGLRQFTIDFPPCAY